jgi:hypothetical protein
VFVLKQIFIVALIIGGNPGPAKALSPGQCQEAGIFETDAAFAICLASRSLMIGSQPSPELIKCSQAGYRGDALSQCVIRLLNASGNEMALSEPNLSSPVDNEAANYRDSVGALQKYERHCGARCETPRRD